MLKNKTKEKNRKKIGLKIQVKNIIEKYNKKGRGHKKEWVKGEEEPIEKKYLSRIFA